MSVTILARASVIIQQKFATKIWNIFVLLELSVTLERNRIGLTKYTRREFYRIFYYT